MVHFCSSTSQDIKAHPDEDHSWLIPLTFLEGFALQGLQIWSNFCFSSIWQPWKYQGPQPVVPVIIVFGSYTTCMYPSSSLWILVFNVLYLIIHLYYSRWVVFMNEFTWCVQIHECLRIQGMILCRFVMICMRNIAAILDDSYCPYTVLPNF